MNFKMIGRLLAQIIVIEAVFMLPALGISIYHGETQVIYAFLQTFLAIAIVAGILLALCRKKIARPFGAREGMVCVSVAWILMSLLGCLPFYLSGAISSYIDAFFEIVSGFTTTGASILADVESFPRGLLYWRSFSHWLGGMGVLVFLLAISPSDGKGAGFTMHLLRAESPGPDVGKLVPKMKRTAMILYLIYVVLTVIDIILLIAGGMTVLEAFCTAFGTAGTGGFGVRNDSMASFSPYLQNVTTVFMFLFGINFSCYYLLLLRQFKSVFKDEELRLYLGIAICSTALIVANTFKIYPTFEETLRHAAFQVSSIITTTGYTTVDYDTWPTFSKSILLMLMIVGASAGSTGGGLKVGRLLLLLKSLRRNIRKILNPQKVMVVRNNNKPVDENVLDNANAYLAAYMLIIVICMLVIALDGLSIETNLSAVLACFNNIGPGMDAVGPSLNFSSYGPLSTIVLSIAMLAGRLEIFPMLILLSRSTWKRR